MSGHSVWTCGSQDWHKWVHQSVCCPRKKSSSLFSVFPLPLHICDRLYGMWATKRSRVVERKQTSWNKLLWTNQPMLLLTKTTNNVGKNVIVVSFLLTCMLESDSLPIRLSVGCFIWAAESDTQATSLGNRVNGDSPIGPTSAAHLNLLWRRDSFIELFQFCGRVVTHVSTSTSMFLG